MPRPLRVARAGYIYHVLNRGNGRRWLFHKDADFAAFVRILAEGVERYPVDVLAWCLMGNHWHLLLRPRSDSALPRLMGWLSTTHARRSHAHHRDAPGHLYQGRYKSFPVQDDDHFLIVARYIHANPLRAKLVKRAQDWKWSSLQNHKDGPPIADWPMARPSNWTARVNSGVEKQDLSMIRTSIARGRPLGSGRMSGIRVGVDLGSQSQGPSSTAVLGRPRDGTITPHRNRLALAEWFSRIECWSPPL